MKHKLLLPLIVATAFLPSSSRAEADNPWNFDVSLYGFAAGMSGDVGVGPANADVDFGFDQVLDNLEFFAMGKVRVGYDRWALTTDVAFMGLQASKDSKLVEPSLSYHFCQYFDALAGAR